MPDLKYHQRREAQEREHARAATDPAIKNIHLELADRHADKAWSIGKSEEEEEA